MLFLLVLVTIALGTCRGNKFYDVTSSENVQNPMCPPASTKSCVYISIDFNVVSSQNVLTFANIDFKKGMALPVGAGYESFAYNDEGNVNTAVLTFSLADHSKLDAEFNLNNGSVFAIENCGKSCHVLMELDTSKFIDGEPEDPGKTRDLSEEERSLLKRGAEDRTTIVTYSLMIYYTPQFAAATPDIPLYIEQLIAETNQGYINSEIPVRVKVLCIEEATISNTFSLSLFRNMKGSDEATLNTADAATLLLSPGYGAYCGIGYLNTVTNGNTFTIARKDCALGYYTFGHELGHNFGCHHNRDTVPATNNPYFSYGYGYHIRPPVNSGLRTILAYSAPSYRNRINHYSSSTVKVNGTWPTGTTTNDNARVITQQRFLMANIGNEANECQTGCNMTDWSNLNCESSNCDCEPSICPAGTEVYSAEVQALNGLFPAETISLGDNERRRALLSSTNNYVWLTKHGFKCFYAEQFHLDSCNPDNVGDYANENCCKNYRVRFCCRAVPSVALAGGSYGYIQDNSTGNVSYVRTSSYNRFELYSTTGTCNREIANTPASMSHRAIVQYVAPDTIIACGNSYQDYCYRFDPDLNQWNYNSRMVTGDSYRASVTAGNRVFAIGGYYQRTPIQVWSGGSWQAGTVGSPVPVYAACATFADGRIFLFGGRIRYPNGTRLGYNRRVQILDLETNEWTIGAQSYHSSHFDCGSIRIQGTKNILLVGGCGTHAELYDFENDQFARTGYLVNYVYKSNLVEIDHGRYINVDGARAYSSRGYGRMAQEYNPTAGTWSFLDTPRFLRGRYNPGATAVPASLFKNLTCEF